MINIKIGFLVTLCANTALVVVTLENELSNPEPIMILIELVHARLRAIMPTALGNSIVTITAELIA